MSTTTTHIKIEKQLVPELRFKEFEKDWTSFALKDITPIDEKYGIVDGPFGSNLKRIHYKEEGVPIITSGYVTNGYFYAKKYLFVTPEKFLKEKRSAVRAGDIVMAKIGARCGASAIFPKNHETSILSGNALKITVDESRFSTMVIWQQLYHLYSTHKIDLLKTVGAQPAISIANLKKFKVVVPKLPEQQKIASFLSALDEKIKQLTKKKALLEDYKKGIMQQLFSGKLRFKDDNGKDYPDWEERRLNEFCTFFSGGTPTSSNKEYYSGNIPFIGSGNIYDSEVFSFISKEALDSSSAKLVGKGDLLYALYGANSGESAISNLEGAINQAILCIRTEDSIEYLNYILVSNKEKIVSKYLQGGQGNLSAQIIKKLKYKFPCYEEQQKIARYLSSIDTKIESITNQITQTQTFKKGLLQQLFI